MEQNVQQIAGLKQIGEDKQSRGVDAEQHQRGGQPADVLFAQQPAGKIYAQDHQADHQGRDRIGSDAAGNDTVHSHTEGGEIVGNGGGKQEIPVGIHQQQNQIHNSENQDQQQRVPASGDLLQEIFRRIFVHRVNVFLHGATSLLYVVDARNRPCASC
ncbi:MAG: hypothetical protein SPG79_00135 [Candidatus Faecousia sp.]|nr:hypothetical protein [Candidatus Faecousia sp.]